MNAAFTPASIALAYGGNRIQTGGTRLAPTMISPRPRMRALTPKTVLIAVMAVAALLAAAFIAVPSTGEGIRTCIGLTACARY